MSWTLAALSAATFLLWLFLLYRLLRIAREERARKRAEKEAAAKAAADAAEAERKKAEKAELDKKKDKVRAALSADPLLGEALMNAAGFKGEPASPEDEAKVEQLARKLPPHVLQILHVAGTQKDIEIDLQTKVVREKANYPTRDIEPVPMSSMEQVSEILPEQLMQEDDQFYRALAQDELLVLQPFERHVERKTLHILLDLSNSMTTEMGNQMQRHNWSRGITVSLLLRAVRGESTYLLRGFAGSPYQLKRASNPDEALKLIEGIINTEANGNNTWIYGAVDQAVADVRSLKAAHEVADVLLITDGDCRSMDDTEAVKRLLGDDVRLHVASIGKQSPALQRVATSYQVFV